MSARAGKQEAALARLGQARPDLEVAGPYVRATVPLLVRCRACGHEWSGTIRYLCKKKHGCRLCTARAREQRKPKMEVLQRIAYNSPGLEVIGHYVNTVTPILVRCRQCQRKWTVSVRKMMAGRGCTCNGRPKRRVPEAEALARIAEANPEVEVIGRYVQATIPLLVRCRPCGREWETTPQRLYQGRGCEPCRRKQAGQARRRNPAEVRRRLRLETILLGLDHETAHVRCRDCQHEWHPRIGNLYKGQDRCHRCEAAQNGERRRLPQAKVAARLRRANPKVEFLSPYRSAHQPVKARCRECGHCWETPPRRLLNGGDCPNCRFPDYGFHAGKPGLAYYVRLTAPAGGLVYKIGVTNRTVEERFGRDFPLLTVLRTWPFARGGDAYAFEQEVLGRHRAHRYQGPPLLSIGNDELFTRDVLGLDRAATGEARQRPNLDKAHIMC